MSDMESAACSTPRHAALETFACPSQAHCALPGLPAVLAGVIEGKKISAASSTLAVTNVALAHMRNDFAPLRAEALPAHSKYLMFGVFRI